MFQVEGEMDPLFCHPCLTGQVDFRQGKAKKESLTEFILSHLQPISLFIVIEIKQRIKS